MAGSLIDQYRRWFEYETDAHALVFASFETVPDEKRTTPEYRRAVSVLSHIVAARRIWLYRLGVIPAAPSSLFAEGRGVDQIKTDWDDVQGSWADYLGTLDDDAIVRAFEYKSRDSGRFRNRVEDILAQLFGHSSYHRGQIAMLINAAGGKPAVTDLIYWCRESVSDIKM